VVLNTGLVGVLGLALSVFGVLSMNWWRNK
jgi:hypothetical protein